MGPSCSGKSTLSKKLFTHLGESWKLVELDLIEDSYRQEKIDCDETFLIEKLIDEVNTWLMRGYNVLVDTNMYDEKFVLIESESKKYILLYCPLNVLYARNEKRNYLLHRSAQRAKKATRYVEKTFYKFNQIEPIGLRIDSSKISIEDSFQSIINWLLLK